MSDESNDNHPWKKLFCISMSENGNDLRTSKGLNDSHDSTTSGESQIVSKSTLTASLLIESLIQQLCTMLEADPTTRNKMYFALCDRLRDLSLIDNSYNMEEFELMRGKYQRALYHLVRIVRTTAGCQNIIQNPNVIIDGSRYRTEFEEINFIGAGGFGSVFRARHYLDGHEYAIKKICVKPDRIKNLLRHVEEVRTLAKLNHTNIVSYKGAWIERTSPYEHSTYLSQSKHEFNTASESKSSIIKKGCSKSQSIDHSCETSTELLSSKSSPSKIDDHDPQQQQQENPSATNSRNGVLLSKLNQIYELSAYESYKNNEVFKSEKSASGIFHTHDIITERFEQLNSTTNIIGRRIEERVSSRGSKVVEGDSDVVSFRDESSSMNNCVPTSYNNNSERRTSTEESDYSESSENITDNSRMCHYDSKLQPRLATLYIHMALCDQTLRQWMDKRVEPTPEIILTSILTQILSGLQYIHSRSTVHHDIKPSNIFITTSGQLHIQLGDFGLACPLQQDGHHPILGTQLYAAPEQLSGKCDPKSDVYSLGIILIELLVPMKTGMERIHVVNELKAGNIPESLTLYHPKWIGLINRLVNADPQMRPSTTDLLDELGQDKDLKIEHLITENKTKDSIIRNLEQENQELRDKLCQLQIEMENFNTQEQ